MHSVWGDDAKRIENRLLRALPAESLKRLEPHLEWVELVQGSSIYRVGAPNGRLYFINRGFVSIIKTMRDGRAVEVGTHGHCDMIGLFGLFGVDQAAWESVVQVPGTALRLPTEVLRAEFEAQPQSRELFEQYTYLVLSNLAQTAACHRLHSLKQRFCRWLLSAHDSARTNPLPLTHEALALMLGVQRSGVSIVASGFQKAGVLRSTRGNLTILDRQALEAETCECYATTRDAFERVMKRHG